MERLSDLLVELITRGATLAEIEQVVVCSLAVMDAYKRYGIENLERKYSPHINTEKP